MFARVTEPHAKPPEGVGRASCGHAGIEPKATRTPLYTKPVVLSSQDFYRGLIKARSGHAAIDLVPLTRASPVRYRDLAAHSRIQPPNPIAEKPFIPCHDDEVVTLSLSDQHSIERTIVVAWKRTSSLSVLDRDEQSLEIIGFDRLFEASESCELSKGSLDRCLQSTDGTHRDHVFGPTTGFSAASDNGSSVNRHNKACVSSNGFTSFHRATPLRAQKPVFSNQEPSAPDHASSRVGVALASFDTERASPWVCRLWSK